MRIRHCLVGTAMLALVACATRPHAPVSVTVQYESSPSGAEVFRDGVLLGRTPLSVAHPRPDGIVDSKGRVVAPCVVSPVTFKWASGATTTVEDACQPSGIVKAVRPAQAPGVKRDLRAETYNRVERNLAVFPRQNDNLGWHAANQGLVSGTGTALIHSPNQAPYNAAGR
jgi:hypothetical protein